MFRNLAALSLLSLIAAGCSGGSDDPQSVLQGLNDSNIKKLANLYNVFQSRNDWRGPNDEVEFKKFIKEYPTKHLERVGINPSDIDSIFICERDDQPFNIRYKVPGDVYGSAAPVIFEKEGSGGKRMVAFLDNTQREVDAAEYDDLWAGK